MKQEEQPSTVQEAKREGEAERWSWVNPAAWSKRMLEALERGVQGNAWYTLIDKVYRMENLREAYKRIDANGGSAGVDQVSTTKLGECLEEELGKLQTSLAKGTYQPQAIKRVYIPKIGGGERPLGIPTVRDRVTQAAIRQVIEPIFEKEFLPCSYGFRPERGCKDALKEVERLTKQDELVVVDADIKGFFDTIKQDKLMELVKIRIKDSRLCSLIERFLKQGIMQDGKELGPAEEGTPQGGVISPLLANIYLHQLDTVCTQRGYKLIRYADDFVIMCKTQQEAELALLLVQEVMNELELTLHPEKTHIVNMRKPGAAFEFLGYRFQNHKGRLLRYPRPKGVNKFKDNIRKRTPRLSGQSMKDIIENLNTVICGWFNYFKHSSTQAFTRLDAWIRSRLRSILRRRRKRGTRNRYGLAHYLWPNAYFANLGLVTMALVHDTLRHQSARR